MAHVGLRLPDDLAERLDAAAKRAGVTRSDFIREALRERLGVPAPDPEQERVRALAAELVERGLAPAVAAREAWRRLGSG